MKNFDEKFEEKIKVKNSMNGVQKFIDQTTMLVLEALDNGSKIILCGNGGSAADSIHIAAEFTGRFKRMRRSLAALSLTSDIAAVTAIGNDFGFDKVFSRQLEGLGQPGDILFCLSTSGKSQNVINAAITAKQLGATSVCLSGGSGGDLVSVCDYQFVVPSFDTAIIQEFHMSFLHQVCDNIDKTLA